MSNYHVKYATLHMTMGVFLMSASLYTLNSLYNAAVTKKSYNTYMNRQVSNLLVDFVNEGSNYKHLKIDINHP